MTQHVFDLGDLLQRYNNRPRPGPGRLVHLAGIQGLDGYNPSNPIPDGGHPWTYVRVEPRDQDFSSWAVPFRQRALDDWAVDAYLPMLRLEDPFVSMIHGTLVVGGVRIIAKLGLDVQWETAFFRGDSPGNLVEFTRGPRNMKDIRLVELDEGRVGVVTRPRGGEAGRGKIGYTELESLDHLSSGAMAQAMLLPLQPVATQWWGANAVYRLGDPYLGVLGHAARFVGEEREYYAIAFVFDRQTRKIVDGPEIIADRSCFPDYAARRPDLRNVVFPAWIDRQHGLLFGGLSDTTVGLAPIADPFAGWG